MKLVVKLPLLACCTVAAFLYVFIFLYTTGNRLIKYPKIGAGKVKDTMQFSATFEKPFPPDPNFKESELGDCLNNGDVIMKNLSQTCGCPVAKNPSPLHRCCQIHMLKMMKDVYDEMIKADIPFILTGGAVQGWLRNNQLKPYDLDINAGLPYSYWYSKVYTDILKRLANRGYCIWFRTPTWTKIWSSIIPVDIRPWSIIGSKLYFAGSDHGNPYNVSTILPKRLAVLEGMNVFLPNQPKEYLDRLFRLHEFIPKPDDIFPPNPYFEEHEIGDCTRNGDAASKNLSTTCGCPLPKLRKSPNINACCRHHLIHLLKEIYGEIVQADIPMVLTGGAVIGWYRNRTLIPYDDDIDAGLEYKYWNSPRYLGILKRLASRRLCVWFRSPTWTKIWSNVMAFDLFAFNVIDGDKIYFDGPSEHNPYKVSDVLPQRLDSLEGVQVFIPDKPENYMDNLYGKDKWRKPLH